jgi:hypothetical protein
MVILSQRFLAGGNCDFICKVNDDVHLTLKLSCFLNLKLDKCHANSVDFIVANVHLGAIFVLNISSVDFWTIERAKAPEERQWAGEGNPGANDLSLAI